MNPISFLSLASKTAKAYESFCRPVCKKHRINQTCLDVILFLANNPEYNTARDLCELRGIRSGNASVAIDTLAGRGLLTRQADPNDRRITRLVLMPEAEPIVADGREIQQQFGNRLVQTWNLFQVLIYLKMKIGGSHSVQKIKRVQLWRH